MSTVRAVSDFVETTAQYEIVASLFFISHHPLLPRANNVCQKAMFSYSFCPSIQREGLGTASGRCSMYSTKGRGSFHLHITFTAPIKGKVLKLFLDRRKNTSPSGQRNYGSAQYAFDIRIAFLLRDVLA